MPGESLPIDAHLPGILGSLAQAGAVVVVAEPGAGKTTRVPPALLDGCSDVLVLQPRRIACRLSAQRVARELGEEVGQRVGYQVRFEERCSSETRLRFVTEGILTRRLASDPMLRGVTAVILDEFHERSLHADFALACLQRLRQTSRPDLQLIVMSATLDAEPVARFLDCAICSVPGRTFPVEVTYRPPERGLSLERQVARALNEHLPDERGDVLVFLPGAAEIRRAEQACSALCERLGRELVVLHGDLPPREQDRAVRGGTRPKVILSTNIAETSLTLPGVTLVVDSGLARIAGYSPFSGLAQLTTGPISRAAAIQRAGRAGRVGPGRCVRLYAEHDFQTRPAQDRPELERADLAELRLQMAAAGGDWGPKAWLQAPPQQALESATALLQMLGALSPAAMLTDRGRRMLTLPVHPRLAQLLIEAEARGIGAVGAVLAALLGERDVLAVGRMGRENLQWDGETGPSDLLVRLERYDRLRAAGFDAQVARNEQVDLATARRVKQSAERLQRLVRKPGQWLQSEADDEQLGMCVLAAFPDRVAKRRRPGGAEVVFARGGAAQLAETSVVREEAFLVAVDATEAGERGRGVRVRLASGIAPEWLLELFPDSVVDRSETRFDSERGRVDTYLSLCFEGLVLDESRSAAAGDEAAAVLAAAVLERGAGKVFELAPAEAFLARWSYAAQQGQVEPPPADGLSRLVQAACEGACTLEDLRQRALLDYTALLLPHDQAARLEQLAPAQITLPSGRRLTVHYPAEQPPYVASRLQDFFGMAQGPKVAGVPLVLHLLAPNQRPVQVTDDLGGFWDRHYPELRRALSRRYPRHPFPEDPRTAEPPAPRPPRARRR